MADPRPRHHGPLLRTAGQILGFYTDWLWFREVQFTSVFVTVLRTQVLLGVVTGAAFFLMLYGNVTLARRRAPREALGNSISVYIR